MFVEWAVFTSLRTGHNEGYQLAAASSDVTEADRRELARWGPGHDALYRFAAARGAVSCHRLQGGCYCLGRTRGAGTEYSRRGGVNLYTWFFLIPEPVAERFAYHPFRMMQALTAAGYIRPVSSNTKHLEPISLVGRASLIDVDNLRRVSRHCGALHLATLLNAVLVADRVGIVTDLHPARLVGALLDLLPPPRRAVFSLTTGLRVSSHRPYQIHVLPNDTAEQRAATRRLPMACVSLMTDPRGDFAPQAGWAMQVYRLIKRRQFEQLADLVGQQCALECV